MLPNPGKRLQTGTDMDTKDIRAKLNSILEAIASGHSCEQILATDRTLSYHDIFHAIAEAPTTFWDKTPAQRTSDEAKGRPSPARTPAKQRTD
jgi:hypothetical protein